MNTFSLGSGMTDAVLSPFQIRGTETDMVYNVISGSGAPQAPVPRLSDSQ